MLTLLLPLLLSPGASADEAAYLTCCADKATCPQTLTLVGPGVRREGDDVVGLWRLTCDDGASYFPWARRDGEDSSRGDILTPVDRGAFDCFASRCALPANLCLVADDEGPRVTRCDDGAPVDDATLVAAPRPARRIATPAPRPAPAPATATARTSPPPASVVAPKAATASPAAASIEPSPARIEPAPRVEPSPVRVEPAPRAEPSPARVAPRASAATIESPATAAPTMTARVEAPEPGAWRDERGASAAGVDLSLPPEPPTPCVPIPARRAPSNDQVALGDEAAIRGDVENAMGHYRAALTVEPCNGFAWAAVGSVLMDAGYASRAQIALEHATRITPTNVRAWTDLGRVHELLGDRQGALSAFHEALERRPDYTPAQEGLRRVTR